MNLADITLKNNRTAWTVYALLMLFGVQIFLSIGRLEYPEFTIRNAQVITSYPGRTSVQVEEEVTEPLEQAIRQLVEVDEVTSTSKPGVSLISVALEEQYFDLEDIWSDLRAKVESVRLPDGAQTPSILDDVGDVYPYVYALRGDGFTDAELLDFAEDIRDEILSLGGVGKVEFHGDQEERIYLEFSSSELAAKGFTPDMVIQRLSDQNAVASSGSVSVGTQRLNLVTLGEFESLEDLADYRLGTTDGASSVRVSDVFDIRRSYMDPVSSRAHFNGERVLCIAVSMIEGGVVTEIGDRINRRLAEVEATLPIGLDIETMFYQPKYVAKSINDFVVNLGQSFFFVLVVMLLFAGWRLAVIVGVLVPSAVLLCFCFLPSAGVLLEMMSIAALIISLGLLVDNAVVVSEQILVRLSEGQERRAAVINAVKGLQVPLLAASGTTIAAFSTIALSPGGSSEFTYSLFAVVSLTLLASWLLSISIIPMMCFYFLKPLEKDTLVGRALRVLYAPYERVLRFTFKMGWGYPVLILTLTIGSVFLFKFVPNIFFPPNERGQFVVDVELPIGTDIEETERRVKRLESHLLEAHPEEIESISSWIGNGGPRWYLSLSPEKANPNYSLLSILTLTETPEEVRELIGEVHSYAEAEMPGTRVTAKTLETGPAVGDPIQIKLFGRDMETLYQLRDQMVAEIKSVPGTTDVRDDWGAWVKQLSIKPDPVRAARLGLDTKSISYALVTQYSGVTATLLREGDKATPVMLRTQDDFRKHPERMADLPIFRGQSGAVPLSQVADVSLEFLPGSILRQDTLRVMTIKCRVRDRFASDVLADITVKIDALTQSEEWPQGYRIEYAGEQAESSEAQGGIAGALPISMSMLSLILISQFNSFRRFGIIGLTIPPMLVGVIPGLLVTGSSFGFMTLLGLIALMGIIVNNAILLIDEFNLQLKDGLELKEAIVKASLSRFRPIIMTTITTIIGLLPLAISGGGMWSSMAYAIMFGLAFGTLLTLLLCPVLFLLFFRRTYARDTA